MSNSSNYTKDVVVFFDGLYKIIFEIPKENVKEVVEILKYGLANLRTSNEVWTLLMNFCEKQDGKKIEPEDLFKKILEYE